MPFLKETLGSGGCGGWKTQKVLTIISFIKIQALFSTMRISTEWLCMHLSENKRSKGRLNTQMMQQNSCLWMLLNSQPAALGQHLATLAPGYPGYRKVSMKSSWQAVPENTPPLGSLPESGNIVRRSQCLVANLRLKGPCVGSPH